MFSLFAHFCISEITYKLNAIELTISGTGKITINGVGSKGPVSQIKSIFIQEGPSEIEEKCFKYCSSLEYIEIPKSVTTMVSPFIDNKKLQQIVVHKDNPKYFNDEHYNLYTKDKLLLIKAPCYRDIPILEGIKSIHQFAFTSKSFNYGNIVVPSSVEFLGAKSFWDSNFDSLSFKGVKNLTDLVGLQWTNIGTITISKSVQTIKAEAFSHAKVGTFIFEEISNLKTIERKAFNELGCSTITLPDSLQTIIEYAFKESTFETINIGSQCSNISLKAFSGCSKLSKIEVSKDNIHYNSNNGILTGDTQIIFIPEYAESLHIPNTVTEIGQTTLQGSKSLKNIQVDGGNNKWSAEGGVLYSKDFHTLIAVGGGVSEINVNINTKTISDYAACGCTNLTKISLTGVSLNTIGEFSFKSTSITSFDLSDSVVEIGKNAFQFTTLTVFNMGIESNVGKIQSNCFEGAEFTTFTIGKKVVKIEQLAFLGCSKLEKVIFPPDSIISSICNSAFSYTGIVHFVVPKTVTELFDKFLNFDNKLETVIFEENSKVPSIPNLAFQECSMLWKVVLPSTCTTIGDQAFIECTALTVIEHRITKIGIASFEGCSSLRDFNFTTGISFVNQGMFKNCCNLKYFSVEEGNEVIMSKDGCVYSKDETILILFPPGRETAIIPPITVSFSDSAFAWSPRLVNVAFYSNSSLESIGTTAFYECKLLKTVQFSDKLLTISPKAFYGCISISTIVLPLSLKTIGEGSFIGCTDLKTIKYCGTNEMTGKNVLEKFTSVLVTDLYPSTTFCTNTVSKDLSYDCDIKPELVPTCERNNLYIPPILSIFNLCLLIS